MPMAKRRRTRVATRTPPPEIVRSHVLGREAREVQFVSRPLDRSRVRVTEFNRETGAMVRTWGWVSRADAGAMWTDRLRRGWTQVSPPRGWQVSDTPTD